MKLIDADVLLDKISHVDTIDQAIDCIHEMPAINAAIKTSCYNCRCARGNDSGVNDTKLWCTKHEVFTLNTDGCYDGEPIKSQKEREEFEM